MAPVGQTNAASGVEECWEEEEQVEEEELPTYYSLQKRRFFNLQVNGNYQQLHLQLSIFSCEIPIELN